MKVLQISADRSQRGILVPGTDAWKRQDAYATAFGELDIVGFSRTSDGMQVRHDAHLRMYPTNSHSRLSYAVDALRIAKKLAEPDVVSAQDPFETGLAAYFIARRFGVPLHVQVHTDFLSPAYAHHSLLNRLRIMIAAFVLKRANGIRVVSNRIKEEIETKYQLRASISVLPIFVDIRKFKDTNVDSALASRFSAFTTKLLVVARLEKEKNIELAIHAFATGAPTSACLIIVGEGSARQSLEALSRALHVSERVFFEGAQNSAAYYPLADLVLVTSAYEGYGLVIVETLAAGKPVLSTDVGIAREAGAIIASQTDFADALRQWFQNGPRTMALKSYPYANFDEYVRAYCKDVEACVTR